MKQQPNIAHTVIITQNAMFLMVLAMISAFAGRADNGSLAYAYPIGNITIDGKLDDWPEHITKYHFGGFPESFVPDGPDDLASYFTIGYDESDQYLYISVCTVDDTYVRNEGTPEWWAHDMQVLYLDPKHEKGPSGVIALEANEYVKKIVEKERNWDPLVTNANWEMAEMAMVREGTNTIYEWRIQLKGYIKEGRTLGMDYVIFDKDDPKEKTTTLTWGANMGFKHECSACLGDVLLLPKGVGLTEISGRLQDKTTLNLAKKIRFQSSDDISQWMDTAVDSLGNFKLKLPRGDYEVFIPNGLYWESPSKIYFYRRSGHINIKVKKGEGITLNEVPEIELLPPPKLIQKEGVLKSEDVDVKKEVDRFVETYMSHYHIPGAALAIIKDRKLFYHQTYGATNVATNKKVDKETLFEGASMTKPIFSFIVNRLAEKNLIDLQIPLHKYLPFDELELDYPEYRKMTAWHVLTHKSGMPNWGKHMVREPGTSYGYSGEAFEYLKRVLEKITGNNILTLIKEELIVPQYIRTMYFSDNAQLRKVFSNGHMDGTPSIRTIPREPQMAFSLHTEALAYTDFMLTLLERRGLKEKTYQQMMEIHSPFPDNRRETDHTKEGMGLGIMLSESELGKMFFHSGNSGDFKCLFRMYEDLGMGFVVFTNSNTGNFLADDLALFLVEGIKNKSEQSKTN